MASHSLCAPNTITVDYAYDPAHPLRFGNYPVSKHSSVASESDFYDDPSYESYSSDEINSRAVALFDFTPENDNEVPLKEGQEIWVSYRHGQGWLVAEDPLTGENGLVPEEYVEIMVAEQESDDEPQQFMPHIMQQLPEEAKVEKADKHALHRQPKHQEDEEWVDTEDEDDEEEEQKESTQKTQDNGASIDESPSLETRLENLDVK